MVLETFLIVAQSSGPTGTEVGETQKPSVPQVGAVSPKRRRANKRQIFNKDFIQQLINQYFRIIQHLTNIQVMENNNRSVEQALPFSYKIIFLGDSGTGKTSLIERFKNDVFTPTLPTIGVDFVVKNMQIDHLNVRLNIIDTAGQEKFESIIRSYYKDVDAVILVYSLTDKSTFDNVQTWIGKFSENSDKIQSLKVLVGTKKDLLDQAKSTAPKKDEIKNLMEKHKILFDFATSAKENINIGQIFEQIGRNLLESTMKKRQNINILKQQQMEIVLNKNSKYKKESTCC